MSNVFPLSGISGLSFDSTLLSPLLFFCLVPFLFQYGLFSACWPILLNFFQNFFQYFSLRSRLFLYGSCLAARRSNLVGICAACCHMTLVFAVMHLYNILDFFYCFCPFLFFFFILFKNLVSINRRNGPRYQRVPALCAFSTGVIPKGLILRKFCVRCLCMFCFM